MAVLNDKINEWILDGIELGATTLVVIAAPFNGDAQPIYVLSGETVEEKIADLESHYQIYQTINL